jgi:dephospho-CoA kinase
MLRVGLTGSIGVGKSFVTSVFEELGCHVLDADQTAREVVMPDTPGLRALTDAFGEEILNTDGTLNRKRLGARIFTDQAERERLNHILHPFIIARQDEIMRGWEAEDPNGIGIIELERLMLRDNLSRDEALRRINSQMPQEEKQKFADYLIDTSDGFELTRTQIVNVHQKLIRVIRG